MVDNMSHSRIMLKLCFRQYIAGIRVKIIMTHIEYIVIIGSRWFVLDINYD